MRVPVNPFDIIKTEDFNSNYKIIAQYFSDPGASYYSNLVGRGNTILVGTRGSGKSMLLKSLYLPVHVEILRREGKDPVHHKLSFIGVLMSCERYEFKIFRQKVLAGQGTEESKQKVNTFWKRCIGHYFALLIIEEMLNTVIKYGPSIGLRLSAPLYSQLSEQIAEICGFPASIEFRQLGKRLKTERKRFGQLMQDSILDIDYSIVQTAFDLSAVIETAEVLRQIPRFKEARFYLLLDDFFFPNLSDDQQKILLELVRVRNEPLSFKIATIPGGMVFKDDSGFELMSHGDEFVIESIEYPDLGERESYFKLVQQVVDNRLAPFGLKATDLFEESADSVKEFLAKLKGEKGKGHIRPDYAGLGTLIHMSSGIIRTFLLLAKKIVDEWFKLNRCDCLHRELLPINKETQTTIVYQESSQFLKAVESREDGLRMSKLVYFLGQQSRERLLNNEEANEYIQIQIKHFENISEEAARILTRAVTNNVFHTYQLTHRTTRRGNIAISAIVANRLLTPELRIAYRDRWRMDVSAEKVNEILGGEGPINIAYHKPVLSLLSIYCPIISGKCDRIDPAKQGAGCFYASPIRSDWIAVATDLFRQQFPDFTFAVEIPPKGDLTCKICEAIHATEFGIYEVTDLNENVLFELALAIGRGKHTFIVCNTEQQREQINALLGIEYIPYQVVEAKIEEICRTKIRPALKDSEPWSAAIVRADGIPEEKGRVLLAMPRQSAYYERTVTERVKSVLASDFGLTVNQADSHSTGNWLRNLVLDIRRAQFCLVDTTELPSRHEEAYPFTEKRLDYLQRVFLLGLCVGVRKVILHGYNSAYNKKMFTDMQGACHFEYTDSGLLDAVRKHVPEVFG